MSLFFSWFTVAISLWHQNSSQQTSLQCLSTINMAFSNEDKILILKKVCIWKGYAVKRLTDEFPEKSWTKRGVNSCWKSCGTQAQLTGGQAVADRTVKRMPNISNILLTHRCTNAICLHFLPYLLNICRKFEFLISQGRVATCMPKVREVMSYGFCSKFHTLSSSANFIRLSAM